MDNKHKEKAAAEAAEKQKAKEAKAAADLLAATATPPPDVAAHDAAIAKQQEAAAKNEEKPHSKEDAEDAKRLEAARKLEAKNKDNPPDPKVPPVFDPVKHDEELAKQKAAADKNAAKAAEEEHEKAVALSKHHESGAVQKSIGALAKLVEEAKNTAQEAVQAGEHHLMPVFHSLRAAHEVLVRRLGSIVEKVEEKDDGKRLAEARKMEAARQPAPKPAQKHPLGTLA